MGKETSTSRDTPGFIANRLLMPYINEAIYALYFGEGGRYTAEQLKNRAAMLDQVEASITLMKQDLKVLSIEFEKYSE